MNIPEELKYTKDHEWCSVEGDVVTVGVTDFAQSELGDIVFVEVETAGETLDKEEVFGSIEAVKTVSDLFMPIGGEIIEFNEDLESEPELLLPRLKSGTCSHYLWKPDSCNLLDRSDSFCRFT